MNLLFLVIGIAVAAVASFYAYRWWTVPVPVAQFGPMGAYLIRDKSLYGGYPTPLIYRERAPDEYIMAVFDPEGNDAVAPLSKKQLQVVLDNYREKFDVMAPHSVDEMASAFREAILAYQATAMMRMASTDPSDEETRKREMVAMSLRPEELITERIVFMKEQLM